ncbi:hypothetical protein [Streptomyces kaniharaensis]|uniref:hypothetical protein n=1 Tax=Streptomyces kaniharaensis TaxID=212423 RepID=UPI0012948EBE|nr:hypothetical protein [Streptomyces kaniharaensis]
MFGLGKKDERSGQQRRAEANRRADRAGRAAMDRYPSSRSTTAWHPSTTPRAWWRSS